MGSLNVEMARAQVSELIETLRALNSNIKKEKDNLSREKDQNKLTAFFKKVGSLAKEVPIVK